MNKVVKHKNKSIMMRYDKMYNILSENYFKHINPPIIPIS